MEYEKGNRKPDKFRISRKTLEFREAHKGKKS